MMLIANLYNLLSNEVQYLGSRQGPLRPAQSLFRLPQKREWPHCAQVEGCNGKSMFFLCFPYSPDVKKQVMI